MDDVSLLRAYTEENSDHAFATLVERHLDLVYSAALRRAGGDPHRAQEITQMVFTALARKAASLVNHPLLAAWLHQSTRWAAASLRRTEHRRLVHEQSAAQDPTLFPDSATEPAANWSALQPLLDDALDSLNDNDRAAILQRFFHQQPFAAIAARLGVSENTARMRVERALAKLRVRRARRGLMSTGAALGLALTQHSVTAAPAQLSSTLSSTALATAATSTTTAGALTTLLMTKLYLGLATAATLALAVGFLWQRQANDVLNAKLAALETQRVFTAATRTTLESEIARRESSIQALATLAAASTEVPPLTPEQQERRELDTFIRKGELDLEYAPLFRRLNLPPQQLDAFKTLLVERNQAIYDATKLAEKNGIVFASLAEQRALTDSVLGEIDARIASTLGSAHVATFREYLNLEPYLRLSGHLANLDWSNQSFETRYNSEADARAEKFARLLRDTAPDFPDLLYRGNGWPIPYPPAFTKAAAELLPPENHGLFQRHVEAVEIYRRLSEIARDAALQGRLQLSKSSARDHPSPETKPAQP